MPEFDYSGADFGNGSLAELSAKAAKALQGLRTGLTEARLPVVFEFSGSPKAGKSSIIAIVAHFLRREHFRVSVPPEGASLETPPDLKDDLLAFNVWCGCYSIMNILTKSHEGDPTDILILDRGLFDWTVWMNFLAEKERLVDPSLRDTVNQFASLSPWASREDGVFLFLADYSTSLSRERKSQLTTKPGRAMNQDFLGDLLDCYKTAAANASGTNSFVKIIDTSDSLQPLNFQRVAFDVCSQILDSIIKRSTQMLLVIDPVEESGFISDRDRVNQVADGVIQSPKFLDRDRAERTTAVQQVVPYGIIAREDGRILCARRKTEGERPELAGKMTMLFGGHAEKRDWDAGPKEQIFRRCLERELSEELIGLRVTDIELAGLINDVKSPLGAKHLAFLHKVRVAGRAAIRRQTADREFGRMPAEWRTSQEIAREIASFDPWSRLAAHGLFQAELPESDQQAGLFGS